MAVVVPKLSAPGRDLLQVVICFLCSGLCRFLKRGLCHEDIDVLGQFCAEVIT